MKERVKESNRQSKQNKCSFKRFSKVFLLNFHFSDLLTNNLKRFRLLRYFTRFSSDLGTGHVMKLF